MSVVINRTKMIAVVCDSELFSLRSLQISLTVQRQSTGIEISKADVLLLAAWLCISLKNPLANGKAKISKTWLQGIPRSVNRASEQFKEIPAAPLLDQCC